MINNESVWWLATYITSLVEIPGEFPRILMKSLLSTRCRKMSRHVLLYSNIFFPGCWMSACAIARNVQIGVNHMYRGFIDQMSTKHANVANWGTRVIMTPMSENELIHNCVESVWNCLRIDFRCHVCELGSSRNVILMRLVSYSVTVALIVQIQQSAMSEWNSWALLASSKKVAL